MERHHSLGEFCDKLGLTKENVTEKLSAINAADLTNGAVLELLNFRSKTWGITWSQFRDSVGIIFGMPAGWVSKQLFQSWLDAVKVQKLKLVKDSLKSQIEPYLQSVFCLPTVSSRPSTDDDIILPEFLNKRVKCLEEANTKLRNINHQLKRTLAAERVQRRTLMRTIRRHEKAVGIWKNKYAQIKAQKVSKNSHKNSKLSKKCINLKDAKRKAQGRCKSKLVSDSKITRQLREDVGQLETQLDIVQENATEQKDSPPVLRTKVDGKMYSPWVREASYQLQNFGVSQKNTSVAIKRVHSASSVKVIGPMPSYTTQNTMTKEMKALSRQQVVENVVKSDNLTLKYDGTTKSLGHLVEVEIATNDNTYLVGLTRQVGGTANEYVQSIQKSLHRIEQTSKQHAEPLDILKKVTNTMTDRCVTNTAVDDQLQNLKGTKTNRFRCAMHPLDSMAKDCEKVIKSYEESVSINDQKSKGNYPFQHRGESNTQALVRTSAKLYHDAKFNCSHALSCYLKSVNAVPEADKKKSVLFHRFVGNRFHVYFLSSGCLYHYREALVTFFTDQFTPQNAVHSSIFNALQVRCMHITTRALGIIGKLVTGPWMRLLGQETNILKMNTHFQQAYSNLTSWSTDASPLLETTAPCAFPEVDVKRDIVFDSLVQSTEFDNETKIVLQDLCKACCDVMSRQLETQLPGGAFWHPSAELLHEAESCSSTNISGERCFATADQEILRARHATTGYIEAKTMFRRNRSDEWLDRQTPAEKSCRIQLAMADTKQIRYDDIADQKEHHERVKDRLISTRKQKLEKEDRSRSKTEKWLETMYSSGGLWANRDELDRNIKGISDTRAIFAMKAQIQVRTQILHCDCTIVLSKASVSDLQEALLSLMLQAVPTEVQDLLEIILNPQSVIGNHFAHKWSNEDGTVKWYNGTFVSCQRTTRDQLDFKVSYENETGLCYMAPEEFIVDVLRGDMHFISA